MEKEIKMAKRKMRSRRSGSKSGSSDNTDQNQVAMFSAGSEEVNIYMQASSQKSGPNSPKQQTALQTPSFQVSPPQSKHGRSSNSKQAPLPQTSASKPPFTQKSPPMTKDTSPQMLISDEDFRPDSRILRQEMPETPLPLEDVDPWDAIELNEDAKKRLLQE